MFKKDINMENRETMIQFLRSHYRYFTGNSWNRATSYANNMKIHNLDVPREIRDKLYDLLDVEEVYERFSELIEDFNMDHEYAWQAKWNGRSGGYLVLYSGGRRKLDYKSRCIKCGQLNYKSIEETGDCRCGRCGKETRINLTGPVYQAYATCKDVDQGEDFEEWDMEELRKRVKVITDFDQLCDDIVAEAVYLAENYELEEETYYVEQTRKVLSQRVTA